MMTCKECICLLTTKDISTISRGERSSLAEHLDNCPQCDTWLRQEGSKGSVSEQDKEEVHRLIIGDLKDPEFWRQGL